MPLHSPTLHYTKAQDQTVTDELSYASVYVNAGFHESHGKWDHTFLSMPANLLRQLSLPNFKVGTWSVANIIRLPRGF